MNYICLIAFLLTGFLAFQNFKNSYIEYRLAKTEGIKVSAEVINVPDFCQRRNNRIDVKFDGREYSIVISNKNCVDGVYSRGDMVDMIYVSRFDYLFFQKATAGFNYIVSISFFILPLVCLVTSLKKRNKKWKN
ncbi:hypothetical protein SAMN05421740_1156 [Parapedobacter koreensis]|uniref:DUF3592 domain-containing protein n=1 Tax=Parapedobacter koreensis TaxID=332977 RepID=A0A1H7UFJ3_9SPHI|nr:hypothetical protein SAMN05421740_1156 [Parapedobacter koreensis]